MERKMRYEIIMKNVVDKLFWNNNLLEDNIISYFVVKCILINGNILLSVFKIWLILMIIVNSI